MILLFLLAVAMRDSSTSSVDGLFVATGTSGTIKTTTGSRKAVHPRQCSEPPQRAISDDFLIIGHAGGDPIHYCENTLEATRSALADPAVNAIEIDLSISVDGHVFLWHDPYPMGFLAMARRLGLGLGGKRCSPVLSGSVPASSLPFGLIVREWGYADAASGSSKKTKRLLRPKIPTLEEWLREFAPRQGKAACQRWVKESHLLPKMISKVTQLLTAFHVSPSRVIFSTSDYSISRQISALVTQHGFDGRRVVSDTVAVEPWIGDVADYNGFKKAVPVCGCCVNLGTPVLAANRWPGFLKIVRLNLRHKEYLKEAGKYAGNVFVWTIDDTSEMRWLVASGVDGIITNRPKPLARLIRSLGRDNSPRSLED